MKIIATLGDLEAFLGRWGFERWRIVETTISPFGHCGYTQVEIFLPAPLGLPAMCEFAVAHSVGVPWVIKHLPWWRCRFKKKQHIDNRR